MVVNFLTLLTVLTEAGLMEDVLLYGIRRGEMGLNKAVLAHAIHISVSPEAAASLIIEWEHARVAVRDRNQKCAKILSEARAQVDTLMKQELCGHQITETHGDPSGGTDRDYQCLICGESVSYEYGRFT